MDTLEFICKGIDDKKGFLSEYTGRGEDISPEFVISNLSANAKTLLITLEDMLHPIKNFTHWIIWNIPASSVIPKGIKRGEYVQGIGYGMHRAGLPAELKRFQL